MAQGRRRSFIAGLLLGASGAAVIILVAVWGFVEFTGYPIVKKGTPLFTNSALDCVKKWGRIDEFPQDVRGFEIKSAGGPFTRSFHVSFYGKPDEIEKWVNKCSGVLDPKCEKEVSEDGSIVYIYPGGDGAMIAKIFHHPLRGTIEVLVYWS